MGRIGLGIALTTLSGMAVLGTMALRYEVVLRTDVQVGSVAVGGLTPSEASRRLRIWWDTARRRMVVPVAPALTRALDPSTLTGLGLRLDDAASINAIPREGFWEGIGRRVGVTRPEPLRLSPVYTVDPSVIPIWQKRVTERIAAPQPARVRMVKGVIQRRPETGIAELDPAGFSDYAFLVLREEPGVQLPLREAPKRVSDEALQGIREVVAQYTTKFSLAQRDRVENIRVASGLLDGTILMPGDHMSFNETVGRRTPERGFRVAGVYRNGRHDFDFGGGICQVSTTLYNAALLSNLAITTRNNHSMPVPYVPLGRDAAVSYGSLDLELMNRGVTPVAISQLVVGNKITFYVLGQRTPGQSVKVLPGKVQSWPRTEKLVYDARLAVGKRRVVDKGGARHRLTTTRVVYVNGVELRREPLGVSYYRGGARIIAVSPAEAPAGAEPLASVVLNRP